MFTASAYRRPAWNPHPAGRVRVCLLLLAFLIAAPTAAFAHAALIGTVPADGAVLEASPSTFSLEFSEPVSPLRLLLVLPDGTQRPLASFRLAGQTLEIDNPEPLGRGTHVLSWRVISADGHPVGGSLLFSVGAPSAVPAMAEPVDKLLRGAIWAAKLALYVGLFLGVGAAFALAWLSPARQHGESFAVAALLCGLIAAPLSLGLQGLDALGAPLSQLGDWAVWQAGIRTSFGWTVLIALAALGLALLSRVLPRADARPAAAAALVAVGAALAASGHASAAEPQWLTRPMVFLHGTAIAFWAGALVPLAFSLKREADDGGFLRRFSDAIPPVVAVLAIAGVALAVVQVRTPSALIETAYGRLLLVKLALLAVLFVLAAVNRWTLTRPAEAGEAQARRKLVRSIIAETMIVLLIFGVAAGWRFTPPPRALALAAAQPASIHIHTSKAMADVTVSPGHVGPVSVSIVVMTGDFGPLDAKELTLVLSNPASGIEPLKRPATKGQDGVWRVDGLVLPLAGRWTVRLDILVSDFDMVKLEEAIDIRP